MRLKCLQRTVEINFGVKIKADKSTKAMFYYWEYGEMNHDYGCNYGYYQSFKPKW